MSSDDLGICMVCEKQPATHTLQFSSISICEDCDNEHNDDVPNKNNWYVYSVMQYTYNVLNKESVNVGTIIIPDQFPEKTELLILDTKSKRLKKFFNLDTKQNKFVMDMVKHYKKHCETIRHTFTKDMSSGEILRRILQQDDSSLHWMWNGSNIYCGCGIADRKTFEETHQRIYNDYITN